MSWMRSRFRRSVLSLAIAALVVSACAEDPTSVTGTKQIAAVLTSGCSASEERGPGWVSGGGSDETGEGEVFGSLYVDRQRYCDDPVWVRLAPISTLTLPANFQDSLQPSHAWPLMWEFWDTNAPDGPCQTGNVLSERAHYSPATGDEQHCVRPGTYTFTGPGRSGARSFVVDYLKILQILDSTTAGIGNQAYVAIDSPNGLGDFADLTINIDLGDTTYSDSAVIDIDTSSAPSTARFKNIASPTGDSSVSWRISLGRSTVSWSPADTVVMGRRGRALARLYKYHNAGWTSLTNYYDYVSNGSNVIRTFKAEFPPPTCPDTSRTYTVGVELMRPDEDPTGVPTTTRTFVVTQACGLTAPSGLDTANVTSTTATILWTNGTTVSGTTTEVQINSGGGWTTTASALAAGVDSLDLTGLSPSTTYDVRIRHTLAGVSTSWAVGSFMTSGSTVTAPTGLGSSSVTSSTATVSWTNGTTSGGTTTEVQIRSGGSWTTVASALSAGVDTLGLTGLSASTTYDVQVRHHLSGNTSSWLSSTGGLFTTLPDLVFTNFAYTCADQDANGHSYNVFSGSWTVTGTPASTAWQVRETLTSTPPTWGPYPNDSGTSGTAADFGWYRNDTGTPDYRYFWVKYESNSTWYPLGGSASAINVADPDLCLNLSQRMTLTDALRQFR